MISIPYHVISIPARRNDGQRKDRVAHPQVPAMEQRTRRFFLAKAFVAQARQVPARRPGAAPNGLLHARTIHGCSCTFHGRWQCACSNLDRRRQGLAPMAAATAVEPLGALLNAPEGNCVRATKPENASAPLQFVPHQVRGFLNAFEKGVVAGPALDKCIACSPIVLSAYVADGFDLLARACNCTTYLDELTGLSELVDDADARMVDVEDSDEDVTLV
ncbi:hypothetical protein PsorP6_014776 [Peronosclerospora sorghi]|uniref:Uncharacterized protein n=1 Tax=Peronosclerospora sorghi TaxID=230839 RepID=A0ACC0VS99_9STRA|nr:hypothetical protein PsorP6_014776 [Peronosclerospora sorghi]